MAYSFNGSTDDILYASHASAFDGASLLTVSVWIKPDATGDAYGHIVHQVGAASGAGYTYGWAIFQSNLDERNLSVAVRDNDTSRGYTSGLGLTVDGSTWYHVLLAFDGSQDDGSRKRLWVNGAEQALAHTAPESATNGTTDVAYQIGESTDARNWNGVIAEIGAWAGRAITDGGTIGALADGYSPLHFPANLVLYSPLQRGAMELRGIAGAPTINGAAYADHPRIIYPSKTIWTPFAAGAAGDPEGGLIGGKLVGGGILMRGRLVG